MKTLSIVLCIWAYVLLAFATTVNSEQAATVGLNWCKQLGKLEYSVAKIDTVRDESTGLTIYFLHLSPSGFIFVSGEDLVRPIIGYGFDADVNNSVIGEGTRAILASWFDKTAIIVKCNLDKSLYYDDWKDLMKDPILVEPRNDIRNVFIPLPTLWNQWEPYNSLTPGSAPGCATIALAQLIRYWSYPYVGLGTHTNNCSMGSYTVNYATQSGYDYYLMPTTLNSNSPTEQVNEVSRFIYQVGVSINADWNWGADAGADFSEVVNALEDHFRYSTTAQHIEKVFYTWQGWYNDLKNEINNMRPVIYGGFDGSTGHAYVLHGYQMVGTEPAFCLNTGGIGINGYYFLDNGASYNPPGLNMTYYHSPEAVIGIQPDPNQSQWMLRVTSENPNSNVSIDGSFIDLMGNPAGGVTPYKRFYNSNVLITLTAPEITNSRRFINWNQDGEYSGANNTSFVLFPTSWPSGSIDCCAVYGTPTIYVSPSSLDFGSVPINTTSDPQAFQLIGENLVDNIVVQTAAGYLISTSQYGDYVNTLFIQNTEGCVNQNVWVRFYPSYVETYNYNMIIATTGGNTIHLSLTGSGIDPGSPYINIYPSNLAFGDVVVNTVSDPQSYQLTGSSLNGDVVIQNAAGYLISLNQNGPWVNTLNISPTGGNVNQIVWVRFQPQTPGSYNYQIVHYHPSVGNVFLNVTGNGVTAPQPPNAPSNLIATAISPVQINVSWTDNSDNETGFQLQCREIQWDFWQNIVVTSANETTFEHSDWFLSPDQEYVYRVRARNNAGYSEWSNEDTATTFPNPRIIGYVRSLNGTGVSGITIVPNNGAESVITDNNGYYSVEVDYHWSGQMHAWNTQYTYWEEDPVYSDLFYYSYTDVVEDQLNQDFTVSLPTPNIDPSPVSSTELVVSWQYYTDLPYDLTLEKGLSNSGPWTLIGTFPSIATYNDTGLLPSTSYYYRIKASYNDLESYYSSEGSTTYGVLTISAIDMMGLFSITADIFRDGVDTGYDTPHTFEQGGTYCLIHPDYGMWIPDMIDLMDGPLISNYSIEFWGMYTGGSDLNPPSNLSATTISPAQIDLLWTDNSDDEAGFDIERRVSNQSAWNYIASVNANQTTFSDFGLIENTQYFYRIYAFDDWYNVSDYSNEDSATTLQSIPIAPLALNAVTISTSQIDISWIDNSFNEDGFKIDRKIEPDTTWVYLVSVNSGTSFYMDTDLTESTTYSYRIYAFNNAGNSDYSNVVTNTTYQLLLPEFAITPANADFGALFDGQQTGQLFTVSNVGSGTLTLTDISLSGSPYFAFAAPPTLPITLDEFETYEFSVTFAPFGPGNYTATLSLTDDLAARTVHTVPLTGTGLGLMYLEMTPDSLLVGHGQGTVSLNVSSNTSWTVTDDADWIICSPDNGSGIGSFNVSYLANTSPDPRFGTITVAGPDGSGLVATGNIYQSGTPHLIVTPESETVSSEAGSVTVQVASNVSWSASPGAIWINCMPADGSGSMDVVLGYLANPDPEIRTATVTFNGLGGTGVSDTFVLTQSGAPFLEISPDSLYVSSSAGMANISVDSNIAWSVSDDADWIDFTPANGTGDGIIGISYAENTTYDPRSGILTVSGLDGEPSASVIIVQEAAYYLLVTPDSLSVSSEEGTVVLEVSTNLVWSVSDNADWLICTPNGGDGSDSVSVSFSANTATEPRLANITFYGGSFVVTIPLVQAGVVHVTDDLQVPSVTGLLGAYPNPFHSGTLIKYALTDPAQVSLSVYNIKGGRVRQLISKQEQPGFHQTTWDGTDDNGNAVGSGLYYIVMHAGKFQYHKKITLIN